MAYFEAMEEAVEQDMLYGHKVIPDLIRSILGEVSDAIAQGIADCAEIADTNDPKRHESALMNAGKLVIGEIYKYLADNHPTAWGDEGDLSEYEEKLRLDRLERTREMQDEQKRMGSYAAMSQEKW